MLIHNVYFWLKDGLTDEDHANFRAALKGLCDIPDARSVYVGQPAPTAQRPVIDHSFTFALTVIFDNIENHDNYQVHELHTDFVKNFSTMWDKLVVYDAD